MKIILAGSTGMIGSEILTQALTHKSITSITILSRRPLPSSQSLPSSVKVILLTPAEFTSYPASVLQEIVDADGCIWALGGLPHLYPTLEIAREVNIDYPVYAANVFAKTFGKFQDKNPTQTQTQNPNKKFKFWYVSGKAVERNLTKPLWILQDARRIKGEIENKLLAVQDQNPKLEIHFARVGSVIPKNNLAMKVVGAATNPFYPAMGVHILAVGMVDAVARDLVKGEEVIVEHDILKKLGEDALRSLK